jgi:hypothetical protein
VSSYPVIAAITTPLPSLCDSCCANCDCGGAVISWRAGAQIGGGDEAMKINFKKQFIAAHGIETCQSDVT